MADAINHLMDRLDRNPYYKSEILWIEHVESKDLSTGHDRSTVWDFIVYEIKL